MEFKDCIEVFYLEHYVFLQEMELVWLSCNMLNRYFHKWG